MNSCLQDTKTKILYEPVFLYLENVLEKDLYKWIMVKNGVCTENEAIKIFNLFFEEDGSHIYNIINSS